jgi:hypothetical protein
LFRQRDALREKWIEARLQKQAAQPGYKRSTADELSLSSRFWEWHGF